MSAEPTAKNTTSLARAPMTGLRVALAAEAVVMFVKIFGSGDTARLTPDAIIAIDAFRATIAAGIWVTSSARRFGATGLDRDFAPNVPASSYYRPLRESTACH